MVSLLVDADINMAFPEYHFYRSNKKKPIPTSKSYKTLLEIAMELDQIDIVSILMEAGVSLYYEFPSDRFDQHNTNSSNLFYKAATLGSREIINLMLEYNVDQELIDEVLNFNTTKIKDD